MCIYSLVKATSSNFSRVPSSRFMLGKKYAWCLLFPHLLSLSLLFTVTIQFLIGWCIYLIILRVFGSQSFRAIIIIFIIFIFLAPFCTSKSDYRGNTL